jgi:CheY-like chemotaxis protein
MDHRIAVLVVEDEALIRMAIVGKLRDAGSEVFEVANANAAIAMLVANWNIRLMFTDIDMPGGMDGLKLAAAIQDRWPPIRIIRLPDNRQQRSAGRRFVLVESEQYETRRPINQQDGRGLRVNRAPSGRSDRTFASAAIAT